MRQNINIQVGQIRASKWAMPDHRTQQYAKDEYGTSKVSLDVNYTDGVLTDKGVSGTVADRVNVVVSDRIPSKYGLSSAGTGVSFDANGIALTFLNVNQAQSNTLAHELSHIFLGDTKSTVMNVLNTVDPFGVVNALTDLHHDYQRGFYSFFGPYIGNRFDPPPGQPLRVTSPFNIGAKQYQAPTTQEAIRPRQ